MALLLALMTLDASSRYAGVVPCPRDAFDSHPLLRHSLQMQSVQGPSEHVQANTQARASCRLAASMQLADVRLLPARAHRGSRACGPSCRAAQLQRCIHRPCHCDGIGCAHLQACLLVPQCADFQTRPLRRGRCRILLPNCASSASSCDEAGWRRPRPRCVCLSSARSTASGCQYTRGDRTAMPG